MRHELAAHHLRHRQTVPQPTVTPGETKVPARLDVGQDGTLLQTANRQVAGRTDIHCEFRWWSGLLR
jgi:hypothetical protein